MKNAGLCWKCKAEIWLPDELLAAARHSSSVGFFCGYGHRAVFQEGEDQETILRRERDRLTQRLAQKDDEIANEKKRRREVEASLSATRGVVTRIKNRVGHGICPCCNRTFENLHRHMKGKHPDYAASEAGLAAE